LARTSEGQSELAKALMDQGADVIEFPKWKKTALPVDLTKVTAYKKILFTSPDSVDDFFTALIASGMDSRKVGADFFGASIKSIKAINKRGFSAVLADELNGSEGLLVVGDESSLEKEFAHADKLVTCKKEIDTQFLPLFKRMFDEADVNTLVFPSSASIEPFVKALGECDFNAFELLKEIQVVSMGEKTAAAFLKAGLPSSGMPAHATKEALVDYLAARPVEEV
ncbi:MAG: uroporphyrinogen-III C-methyltransferase, partial [Neobacillus sp.]|nr:uroporphyrinogen-III C-methyltransferase [Neobacillus sp.]